MAKEKVSEWKRKKRRLSEDLDEAGSSGEEEAAFYEHSAKTVSTGYQDQVEHSSLLQSVRTLSDLYEIIPSPRPAKDLSRCPPDVIAFITALSSDDPDVLHRHGIQTRLHRYQRRTLSVMLQREYDENCVTGGVLCEEMGTGKTLECLALVLATRGSIPSVPPEASYGTDESE